MATSLLEYRGQPYRPTIDNISQQNSYEFYRFRRRQKVGMLAVLLLI